MNIIVRPAGASDMARVQEIYKHHVLHGTASFEEVAPDIAELRRRRIAVLEADLPYLVAERDGAVIGYAYAGRYRTHTGIPPKIRSMLIRTWPDSVRARYAMSDSNSDAGSIG